MQSVRNLLKNTNLFRNGKHFLYSYSKMTPIAPFILYSQFKQNYSHTNSSTTQTHPLDNFYLDASLNKKQGKLDEALKQFENLVVQIQKEKQLGMSFGLSELYLNIGNIYSEKQDYEKAKENWNKSIKQKTEEYGEDSLQLLEIYNPLADEAFESYKYEDAIYYAEQSLNIIKKHYKEDHPDIGKQYFTLGVLYFERHHFVKALENCQKALEIYLKNPELHKEEVSFLYLKIAETYALQKDEKQAIENYQKGVQFTIDNFGEEYPKLADYYLFWSDIIRYNKEKLPESKSSLQKALNIYLKSEDVQSLTIIDIHFDLGVMLYLEANYEEALKHFQESLQWTFDKGPLRPKVAEDTYNFVGLSYLQLKKFDESIENFNKALESCEKSGETKHLDVYHRNLGLAMKIKE